jgi:hypothetical protein
MSSEQAPVVGRLAGIPARTGVAVRGALRRTDGRAVLAVAFASYLAAYLYGVGHLGTGAGGTQFVVVDNPVARAFEPVGPYQWEPVALAAVGPVELLVAPLNVALGSALAALVGLNLAVSWVAWRGPSACRVGPGAGAAAGLPALLSGMACCGPTLLVVLGVQASAGLLAAFQWLVPASVALLVATLLWVGVQVELEAAA